MLVSVLQNTSRDAELPSSILSVQCSGRLFFSFLKINSVSNMTEDLNIMMIKNDRYAT